jgi:hypothetical protein
MAIVYFNFKTSRLGLWPTKPPDLFELVLLPKDKTVGSSAKQITCNERQGDGDQ